jgi:hypothetical protein
MQTGISEKTFSAIMTTWLNLMCSMREVESGNLHSSIQKPFEALFGFRCRANSGHDLRLRSPVLKKLFCFVTLSEHDGCDADMLSGWKNGQVKAARAFWRSENSRK